MNEKSKGFVQFSGKEQLLPQEEVLEKRPKKNQLIIGLPKEQSINENRIALVPDAVNVLVENGNRVIIEENAGASSHFLDMDYAEAGAEVVSTAQEVFKSDIILKIAPPIEEELAMMGQQQSLISSLFLPNREKSYFTSLLSKRVKAISYEHIQDKTGAFPVIKSISEIVGNVAVLVAAEYLSNRNYGNGVMLGGFPGIKPTEVVVIGAGTVAEYSVRMALGMGAAVKVFDNSIYKLRAIQRHLGSRVYTSTMQPDLMLSALKGADVVISAKHAACGATPCLVTEDMVRQMKAGSVVIDVSIDQGGCFETSKATSHQYPVYQLHGVTHYCVPNIASRVPYTASYALSNFLTPLLLSISEVGGLDELLKRDTAIGKGVYAYNGIMTNKHICDLFDLPFRDLELLMAAYR